jgi:hypothetical protein
MRKLSLLAAAFALSLVASPSLAKPKDGGWTPPGQAKKEGDWMPPGQAKKQDGWVPPGQAKKQGDDQESFSGPGNSGNVRYCRVHWREDEFWNFGQCVSAYARGLHTADDEEEDANEDGQEKRKNRSDGSNNQHGDLDITSIDIDRDDQTFLVKGAGAEGSLLFASVGGGSGLVVGFGLASSVNSDGTWEVRGEWACQDSESRHEARIRVYDSDERVSELASFPCRVEN